MKEIKTWIVLDDFFLLFSNYGINNQVFIPFALVENWYSYLISVYLNDFFKLADHAVIVCVLTAVPCVWHCPPSSSLGLHSTVTDIHQSVTLKRKQILWVRTKTSPDPRDFTARPYPPPAISAARTTSNWRQGSEQLSKCMPFSKTSRSLSSPAACKMYGLKDRCIYIII